MTPYYADDWLTVYHGDSRAVMAELPAESVHCVVTSPPYWGLRDYGTASWTGGDEGCDHRSGRFERGGLSAKQATNAGSSGDEASRKCHCGAIRIDSQLGLEATPEEYVANMVAVFREVRRVLRSDGTVWLNLGDSYAGGTQTGRNDAGRPEKDRGWAEYDIQRTRIERRAGLKPKDLVGIPWRVAFALQADGWYLRSDIIWAKPNPMPESVTDRPTKSHEYLFLLAKSARYHFDADAVREGFADERMGNPGGGGKYMRDLYPDSPHAQSGLKKGEWLNGAEQGGRNIRTVWTIPTAPYPGAHFATFPPKLVEPCIKAGTSERGVCPDCGAPWQRIVERAVDFTSGSGRAGNPPNGKNGSDYEQAVSGTYDVRMGPSVRSETTGWQPSCGHDAEPVPATVLDPFAGSGTTGMVAQSLSRRGVLIDLSMDYLRQLMERNRDIPLGLGA